jgi:carbonic anhydrase
VFTDPFDNVRQSVNRLRHSPFVFHKEHITGFVYDVETGLLDEVRAELRG